MHQRLRLASRDFRLRARSSTSGASVTIAFSSGFNCAIRSRYASTTSTGDTSRFLIIAAMVPKLSLIKSAFFICLIRVLNFSRFSI
jgi:hypothetical protein